MALFDHWSTVFSCLVVVTISAIIWLVKYYYGKIRIFELGRKLPGPKPWPIIGNAWHFIGSESDILVKLRRYKAYKKLCAIWLGHQLSVFVTAPEFAELCCKSPNLLDRSEILNFLNFIAPKGLLLANGADWKKGKKLIEPRLSNFILKNSIPIIQTQAEICTRRLKSEVGKSSFSILTYAQECTFDILCELTADYELKAQTSEVTLLKDIHIMFNLVRKRLFNALQQWDFVYKLFPEGKQFYSVTRSGLKTVDEILVRKKKRYEDEKGKEKSEVLQKPKKLFLESLFDNEELSLSEIRDHVLSIIIAGHDTTAITISCALILLALYPEIQEKAYQEIISVVDGNFDDEMFQNLKYLDMVVKETLRLFPSAPLTPRKATGDVQLGEYLIPAGADVGVNIYELHRDPEQYDNPNEFNPDNFLPENIAKRHPYSYMPFSSGLRKCVGSKLAPMIIKVVVAKILLSYKVECDYKGIDDIKFRGDISIELDDGGLIRILPRFRDVSRMSQGGMCFTRG